MYKYLTFPASIKLNCSILTFQPTKNFSHVLISQNRRAMSTAHTKLQAHLREPVPSTGDFDTSLSLSARQYYKTYGLTPPVVESYQTQALRCLKQLESKTAPIEKYLYLSGLRNTNVHLFYRLAVDNMKELTPLIYTPVVGEACLRWSEIYMQPEGLYISYADRGHIASVLQNWPQNDVEITVVTDGSRILGLGDLGINGMGIPVGKLALYSACGGIRPNATLPLCLDLGTSNEKFRKDPLYMGSRRGKVTAIEEAEFLDELMEALVERWPGIVIQFEDFKNPFPSLERYGGKYTMFNDDIQGTGAVILAGIINAVKQNGVAIKDQRAVLMGAGSAAVGVAKQIVQFFMEEGLTEDEARRCFSLVDTKGLVTNDRGDKLADHKVYFSRDDNEGKQYKTLPEVVEYVKPTILMGLSTIGGIFDSHILTRMGEFNKRPIIFPLSNPSTNSECTYEDAVKYTDGRVLFASGSPFDSLEYDGKFHTPGQGNNMVCQAQPLI
jgi:malate dehydrogenase (oxaloacetate-decarboxylating)(NADP+)